MLYEATFTDWKKKFRKFIVSASNEEKSVELAKRYVESQGGATSKVRMSLIRKLPQ